MLIKGGGVYIAPVECIHAHWFGGKYCDCFNQIQAQCEIHPELAADTKPGKI